MALIQFSTNFDAHKAISCPDAVLGNRFIRIFWYKSEAEQQKVGMLFNLYVGMSPTNARIVYGHLQLYMEKIYGVKWRYSYSL